MDASSSTRLPVGVSATRIPAWILPTVGAELLDMLRPDILILRGISASDTRIPSHESGRRLSARALALLQASCVVHVVELQYTHDSVYADSLAKKLEQHAQLLTLLKAAGWTLFAPPSTIAIMSPCPVPHVILLGSFGTVFSSISPVLLELGVSRSAVPVLLRALHVHAVVLAAAIVRARRRLERSPAAFHSSALNPHPYPP